jgi:hypothetical protein
MAGILEHLECVKTLRMVSFGGVQNTLLTMSGLSFLGGT